MAKLEPGINFTGTIAGITAYRIKGSDKIYLRKARGHSRQKVLKAPEFERTRENASEFGLCANVAGSIRRSLAFVAHLADHNFTSSLVSLAKKIQCLDEQNIRGQRIVLLPQYRSYFKNFSLNQRNAFDAIVRHPAIITIDRNNMQATVTIPELVPGVGLFLPWPVPSIV